MTTTVLINPPTATPWAPADELISAMPAPLLLLRPYFSASCSTSRQANAVQQNGSSTCAGLAVEAMYGWQAAAPLLVAGCLGLVAAFLLFLRKNRTRDFQLITVTLLFLLSSSIFSLPITATTSRALQPAKPSATVGSSQAGLQVTSAFFYLLATNFTWHVWLWSVVHRAKALLRHYAALVCGVTGNAAGRSDGVAHAGSGIGNQHAPDRTLRPERSAYTLPLVTPSSLSNQSRASGPTQTVSRSSAFRRHLCQLLTTAKALWAREKRSTFTFTIVLSTSLDFASHALLFTGAPQQGEQGSDGNREVKQLSRASNVLTAVMLLIWLFALGKMLWANGRVQSDIRLSCSGDVEVQGEREAGLPSERRHALTTTEKILMGGAPAAAATLTGPDGEEGKARLQKEMLFLGVTLAVTIIAVCFALMIAIGSLVLPGLQDVAVGKIWLLIQIVLSFIASKLLVRFRTPRKRVHFEAGNPSSSPNTTTTGSGGGEADAPLWFYEARGVEVLGSSPLRQSGFAMRGSEAVGGHHSDRHDKHERVSSVDSVIWCLPPAPPPKDRAANPQSSARNVSYEHTRSFHSVRPEIGFDADSRDPQAMMISPHTLMPPSPAENRCESPGSPGLSVSIEIDRACPIVHRSHTIAGAHGDGVVARGSIESEALFNEFQRHSMPPLRDVTGFLGTSSPAPLPVNLAGGTPMQRSPESCIIDAPVKAVVKQRRDAINTPKRASAPVPDPKTLASSFTAEQSSRMGQVRPSSTLNPSFAGREAHAARRLSQLSATSEEQATIQSAKIGYHFPAQNVMIRTLSRSGSRRKPPPPLREDEQRIDDGERNTIPFFNPDSPDVTISNVARSHSNSRLARSRTDPRLRSKVGARDASPSSFIGIIPVEPVSPAALKMSEATAKADASHGAQSFPNFQTTTSFPAPPLARAFSRKRPRSADEEARHSHMIVEPCFAVGQDQYLPRPERSTCLESSPTDVVAADPTSDFDDYSVGPAITILVREPTLRDVVGNQKARNRATASGISQLSVTSFVAGLSRSASASGRTPSPLRAERVLLDASDRSSAVLAQRGSREYEQPLYSANSTASFLSSCSHVSQQSSQA